MTLTSNRAATRSVDPDPPLQHRAMWASGNYAAIVADLVARLGPVLVEATAVSAGDHVLDVAAGTGNVAIPAALAGARVVATDLTPELLERGKAIAAEVGAVLQWRQADAEALPFADDSFDTVVSSIGVMWAPHHQAAADELTRVCRPGGRIGVISWTPGGFLGQVLATMAPFMAPAPPGVLPPTLWGDEDYVRALLGDRVVDFRARRGFLSVDLFPSGEAFREYFKANCGPTVSAYRHIADDPSRVAALDADLAALGERALRGSSTMQWEYLLVSARGR